MRFLLQKSTKNTGMNVDTNDDTCPSDACLTLHKKGPCLLHSLKTSKTHHSIKYDQISIPNDYIITCAI